MRVFHMSSLPLTDQCILFEKMLSETCYGFLPPNPFDMAFTSDLFTEGNEGSDCQKSQRFSEKISFIHATVEA